MNSEKLGRVWESKLGLKFARPRLTLCSHMSPETFPIAINKANIVIIVDHQSHE